MLAVPVLLLTRMPEADWARLAGAAMVSVLPPRLTVLSTPSLKRRLLSVSAPPRVPPNPSPPASEMLPLAVQVATLLLKSPAARSAVNASMALPEVMIRAKSVAVREAVP